ncbi:hypothetical protein C9374_013390 [Naegleria lovaniensis]|uniref:Uncharacterized protein n=1 Tax=Naegleria lovaniensis TaxID=51637 RepID=A0AA88GZ64_NAELO|nr:uncharacterized protein C9374_013390 [Naegleria lovaniensis]KAG2391905.1 hypothetical protein C9374_013390 [Naegleria lovaniensis]
MVNLTKSRMGDGDHHFLVGGDPTHQPEPEAFDKQLRKEFRVDDCVVGEFEVGSLLSKSTLFICKDRILNKKPKLNISYKDISSLKCIKKKVTFVFDTDNEQVTLKCKNIESSTSIYNLVRELYHIQAGKALETIELGEKNSQLQNDIMPARVSMEQDKNGSVDDNNKKPATGGIVAQMLGKTIVDFKVLILNQQHDYLESTMLLQKQSFAYSSHEFKFSEITQFSISSLPFHLQIKLDDNPKIKSITFFCRDYISFAQTLKKKHSTLEINFSPNCRSSKIKGGWCNDVAILGGSESGSGHPPVIMMLKPTAGTTHKKVLSMVSPLAEAEKKLDDIHSSNSNNLDKAVDQEQTTTPNKMLDLGEVKTAPPHLRSRSVFTPNFSPSSVMLKPVSSDKRLSDKIETSPMMTGNAFRGSPSIVVTPEKSQSVKSPQVTSPNNTTSAYFATPTNSSNLTEATNEEGKIVHLNIGRAKQAKRAPRKAPSGKDKNVLFEKLEDASKERVIMVGSETITNPSVMSTTSPTVDLDAITQRRKSSVKGETTTTENTQNSTDQMYTV